MRVPVRLEPLLDLGVLQEVLRPLMSGKEAEVYLVRCAGEECVAKVYKNAQFRSFQHRAEYIEGRRVRSSREQRAMDKKSRHGRLKTEEAWRSTEADAIYALHAAGIRVPEPVAFIDGVLVMELIKDETGAPAPRLVDRHFDPEEATEVFHVVLGEVVKMLCAGIVHADLSDFNVLMGADGPVLIDFPQAVDPSRNQNARSLLLRDLENLTSFLGRFAPQLRNTKFGPEMWDLYERNQLEPDTQLTGTFEPRQTQADVGAMLEEILLLEREARERREALGLPPPRRARRPIVFEEPAAKKSPPQKPHHAKQPTGELAAGPCSSIPAGPAAQLADEPTGRRRRRRRNKRAAGSVAQRPPNAPRPAAPRPPVVAPAGGPPAEEDRKPRRSRRRRRRRGGRPAGGNDSPSSSG